MQDNQGKDGFIGLDNVLETVDRRGRPIDKEGDKVTGGFEDVRSESRDGISRFSIMLVEREASEPNVRNSLENL